MRIAIIGAGISGLVTAYLLSQEHDIVVYESNDYIGGHTHTIDVPVLPCEHAGAAGRANGRGSRHIVEAHAFFGDAIDIGRVREIAEEAAVCRDSLKSMIIHQHDE